MPPDEHLDNSEDDDSPVIRDLRQRAKRADEAEARATELERRLAVSEAGLTGLSDKRRVALFAAHDGDLEPDALKATAIELGYIQPEVEPAQTPPDERAANERINAAGAGAPPAGGKPELLDKIRSAGSEAEYWAAVNEAGLVNQEGQVFSPRI